VLGNAADELARLDHQARNIERPTRLILQAASIGPGMRVLDLGTGLGHVAMMAGELVGANGSVIGIDRSDEALTIARERASARGLTHVTFATGDATEWKAMEQFDAVIGRLLLFHVADPVAVVRHHIANLRPGGAFVAVDFDLGNCRTEPPITMAQNAIRWVHDAFRASGAWPRIGSRLGTILEEAGLTQTVTFGVQGYLSPRDPAGAPLLAGVLRSMAPAIMRHRIATEDEIGVATFEQRLREAVQQADAVILPPTVVGAWGTHLGNLGRV
jgi:ubiquinone/menaquinone biosynthesis C-methylase UbiE